LVFGIAAYPNIPPQGFDKALKEIEREKERKRETENRWQFKLVLFFFRFVAKKLY